MFTIYLVYNRPQDYFATFHANTIEEANRLFDAAVEMVGSCLDKATVTLTGADSHVMRNYNKPFGYGVPTLADWRAKNPAPSCSTSMKSLLEEVIYS